MGEKGEVPLKMSLEGGLRQMSVAGGARMVKGEEDILRFYGAGLMIDDGMSKG